MKVRRIVVCAVLAVTPCLQGAQATAGDVLIVDGYFCDSRDAQLAFAHKLLDGQNEITASNEVNKSSGKAACMPFHLATAILSSEENVIDNGSTIVLRSFKFLPENAERWHSSVSGSLSPVVEKAI